MRWASSIAILLMGLPALLAGLPAALAGEADVIAADARHIDGESWSVSATIRHADTGWEHYADRFDVLAPDGTVLAERVLFHPHVEEQPFTRSVRVTIPGDIGRITVRAHDSVHGLGGMQTEVVLER